MLTAILDRSLNELLWYGAAVSATLIVVRLAWVLFSGHFAHWTARRRATPLTLKEGIFIGWAGMRGGDSLVIALALPLTTSAGTAFPARPLIIFITFCVIFVTLVLQGLTLAGLLRRLGLDVRTETGEEEAHARRVAAEAGLERLEKLTRDGAHAEVARYLRQRHRSRARRWTDREDRRRVTSPAGGSAKPHRSDTDERRAAVYRDLREEMIRAEREALIRLRDDGTISDDVLRRVQRDLDLEGMLLEAAEPVGDTPQDVSERMQ